MAGYARRRDSPARTKHPKSLTPTLSLREREQSHFIELSISILFL